MSYLSGVDVRTDIVVDSVDMQTLSIINPLSPSADAELGPGGAAGPTAGAGPRHASQITPVSPLSRL